MGEPGAPGEGAPPPMPPMMPPGMGYGSKVGFDEQPYSALPHSLLKLLGQLLHHLCSPPL